MSLLLINGPNLNMLGQREPEVYGTQSLDEVEKALKLYSVQKGQELATFSSNEEGKLVTRIQDALGQVQGIVINAGAYTHTSVAILDALRAVALPVVEVHLSNIYQREVFRHHSYISSYAEMVICGAGVKGYYFAIEYLVDRLK